MDYNLKITNIGNEGEMTMANKLENLTKRELITNLEHCKRDLETVMRHREEQRITINHLRETNKSLEKQLCNFHSKHISGVFVPSDSINK